MFELNDELVIKKEYLLGSVIYIIDDFYKNPQEIDNYLFSEPAPFWKMDEVPTCNNVYFEDRRLHKPDDRLKETVDFLSNLVSQIPCYYDVITNQAKFYKHNFNDIDNCHWAPHIDNGYNGIVYFNDDSENGTNIYQRIKPSRVISGEHYRPWKPKKDFKILKHLEPKYNRLVFFDGYKFLHGMNIVNEKYFSNEYRNNQVFFFECA